MQHFVTALLLLSSLASARAASKPELIARLGAAAAQSTLYAPTLKPWHMKLAFTLYDDQGTHPETGVLEEWWSSPEQDRITYTSPSFNGTVLITPEGRFHTPGMGDPTIALRALHESIVNPIPSEDHIADSTPDVDRIAFGSLKLDCIVLPPKGLAFGDPPPGLFATYCLMPGSGELRFTRDFVTRSVFRNGMGHFQGQSVSTNLRVMEEKTDLAVGKIAVLATMPATEMNFVPTGLEKDVPPAKIPANAVAGTLLQKTIPRYPESAKAKHISGNVILHAIIGRDGHIREMEVVSTPTADLAIAAFVAVRQWVYKPYVVNGAPAEVDTTITVQFSIG